MKRLKKLLRKYMRTEIYDNYYYQTKFTFTKYIRTNIIFDIVMFEKPNRTCSNRSDFNFCVSVFLYFSVVLLFLFVVVYRLLALSSLSSSPSSLLLVLLLLFSLWFGLVMARFDLYLYVVHVLCACRVYRMIDINVWVD